MKIRNLRRILVISSFFVLLVLAIIENSVRAQVAIQFGNVLGRDFLRLNESNRRSYAAGFMDALVLAPLLQNTLAGMGVINCFEGMTDQQMAAMITKQLADHPELLHTGTNVQGFNALLKICPEFQPARR